MKSLPVRQLIILIIFAFIYTLMIVFTSPMLDIFLMATFCCIVILISNFDILHPCVWFTFFHTLYSLSYPILYVTGNPPYEGYSESLVSMSFYALGVVLLVLWFPKHIIYSKMPKNNYSIGLLNKGVIYAFCISIAIGVILISQSGFDNKDSIYASGDIFYSFIFKFALILTIYFIFTLSSSLINQLQIPKSTLIIIFLLILLLTLFSGERDLLFRLVLTNVLTLYAFNKIRKKELCMLIPLLAMLVPISAVFKYYMLTGEVTDSYVSYGTNLVVIVFGGEFSSASRNLQIMLTNYEYVDGLIGLHLPLLDFLSTFNSEVFSAGRWYMQYFYPERGNIGYGFTLVGEGILMGGYLGITMLYIILGIFIRYMYVNSSKNVYWFTAYIYFIPMVIYITRADLANLISPFIKYVCLSLFFIKVMISLTKK